jgi:molecular chaperone GrpE (heat shock protein)
MSNDSPGSGAANSPHSPPDPAKDSEAAWDRYINEGVPDSGESAESTDPPESPAESPTHLSAPAPEPSPPEPSPMAPPQPEPAELEDDPGYLIAGEDDDEIIDPIQIKLEEIHGGLEELRRDFEFKLKNDAQKNKIIDGLHQELQAYKNDIVKSHLRSLVMDVIQFIDNTRKLTQHYAAMDEKDVDPTKLLHLLEGIPSDLEDLISRQGVTPFTCESREFDPSRQRAIKRLPTPEADRDKKVAETVHPGYHWDGQIIRPEMVMIHVFKPAPAEPETQEGTPDE